MIERRVGLVGCVKQKASERNPSKDLYTSALFLGRRRFVERSCDEWWILSAEHGLVHPDDELDPYDLALKSLSRPERRAWASKVLRAIDERIHPTAGAVIEMHAGAEYRDFGFVAGLAELGLRVENPTSGLGIGLQLRFYADPPHGSTADDLRTLDAP